jgi:hypothetical protein
MKNKPKQKYFEILTPFPAKNWRGGGGGGPPPNSWFYMSISLVGREYFVRISKYLCIGI